MLREPQKCMRDPLFHAFSGDLAQARLHLVISVAKHGQGIDRDDGMFLHQGSDGGNIPTDQVALFDRRCRSWVVSAARKRGKTHKFSGTDVADDDLLAVGRRLRRPQPADDHNVKLRGGIALIEQHLTGRQSPLEGRVPGFHQRDGIDATEKLGPRENLKIEFCLPFHRISAGSVILASRAPAQ